MIPDGTTMNWHGHKLVFESENDQCRGCFFADKNECPDCDEGAWVEDNPNPWHTGTPTEEGWYLLYIHGVFDDKDRYIYEADYYGKDYYGSMVWAYKDEEWRDWEVVAYQKIVPYKETNP